MNYKSILDKILQKMKHFEVNTTLHEDCPISIVDMNQWEWAQGVGLYGMQKYYEETKDHKILDYLKSWFDNNLKKKLPEKNINTMCPLLTLAYLYEYTKEEVYLDVCKEWSHWLMYEMHRTPENGFPHLVSGYGLTNDLWDDTLYMSVLFLAKMGKLLNKADYVEESIRQFLVHIKYLADKETGLFFHGFSFDGHHNFGKALWGRGNCWYTAGLVDYLDLIGEECSGVKMYLIDTLCAQVNKLKELQNENGMWHTLLNEPETYVETSATAGFVYGILKAVRLGYIDEKYKEVGIKGLHAIVERIDADGTVLQVSYGTGVSYNLDMYRTVPICPMMYGQALAMLAIVEGLKQ